MRFRQAQCGHRHRLLILGALLHPLPTESLRETSCQRRTRRRLWKNESKSLLASPFGGPLDPGPRLVLDFPFQTLAAGN
ncbi:hypothetical protein BJX70DRAFT_288764 [Aspergillus crustosus]